MCRVDIRRDSPHRYSVLQIFVIPKAFSVTKKSSARSLADNLNRKLQLMRKRLSTRSMSSKTMGLDEKEECESARTTRKPKISRSVTATPPASGGLVGAIIEESRSTETDVTENQGNMAMHHVACIIQ